MFTGIIQAVGRLGPAQHHGGDLRLRIEAGGLDLSDAQLGESIAVSGVCLTVVAFDPAGFSADVSTETLALTTLGRLGEGACVNLERALRAGDRLGGHLVSGFGRWTSRRYVRRCGRYGKLGPSRAADADRRDKARRHADLAV